MWQGRPGVSASSIRRRTARADRQGGDVADGEPSGVAGLHLVTAGLPLSGRAWKRTANGWRTSPARGSAMTSARVGVDADLAGDLHGDAGLLGGTRIAASDALARVDVPPGNSSRGVAAAHPAASSR